MAVVFAFLLSSEAFCAGPVKIKGFYIGMGIEDALTNFERLGFEGLRIREITYKKTNIYYSITPGSGDRFKIETSLNSKSVNKIVFSGGICNRLFNIRGLGAVLFKELFVAAYDILDMKPFKDNPGTDAIKGWQHYNLKQGYRIRIYLNKDLEMIKTSQFKEFSFD